MHFNKKLKSWIARKDEASYWWKIRQSLLNSRSRPKKYWLLRRYYRYMTRMGSHIPIETRFASCPTMPHGIYGVFTSMGAQIGERCVIFQQVTIGSNTIKGSKKIGSPCIGNDCYIGAGAKIIGNVKIGNNVRIGANCVVTTDVPDNTTVVSASNRMIEHDFPLDNKFYYFEQLNGIV